MGRSSSRTDLTVIAAIIGRATWKHDSAQRIREPWILTEPRQRHWRMLGAIRAHHRSPRRWRGPIPALAIGTILIGAGVAVATVLAVTGFLRSDEAEPVASLRRPPPGEVRPDHLADGTPVWVVGHQDGTVDVVSAFDTHVPLNLGKLNWWCPSAEAFENPAHGSKWDEYGVRIGGPAPFGLSTWEATVQGSRVLVGAQRAGAPMGTQPTGPSEVDRDWCTWPGDRVVIHSFADWRVWESPTEALRAEPDGWILLAARLVPDPGQPQMLLCALDGCADSVVAAGIEVPPNDVGALGVLDATRFIARVRDAAVRDLTRIVSLGDAGQ